MAAPKECLLFNLYFFSRVAFEYKDVYDTALPWRQYNKLYGPL